MKAATEPHSRGAVRGEVRRPIRRPVLHHSWSEIAFAHWPYPPETVQRLLPEGLEVDTWDGMAWVGLVPFHLRIRIALTPEIPWISRFEEMNVRTYVRGPDGGTGVWFVSLEAARLLSAAVARAAYGLNYCWSEMRFQRVGRISLYSARRRYPGRRGTQGTMAIEIGDSIPPASLSDVESFLTERWAFYCKPRKAIRKGRVDHPRWPLRRATLLHCDPALLEVWGLPKPEEVPIVHYSDGVAVRMSWPRAC
jgi:uncharacterized protein YqjF (DUF2071 family)